IPSSRFCLRSHLRGGREDVARRAGACRTRRGHGGGATRLPKTILNAAVRDELIAPVGGRAPGAVPGARVVVRRAGPADRGGRRPARGRSGTHAGSRHGLEDALRRGDEGPPKTDASKRVVTLPS